MSEQGILNLLVVLLIGAPAVAALIGYNAGRKVAFPPAPKCHQWGRWTATEVVRTLFGKDHPPEAGQTRECSLCGKREIRPLGGA